MQLRYRLLNENENEIENDSENEIENDEKKEIINNYEKKRQIHRIYFTKRIYYFSFCISNNM